MTSPFSCSHLLMDPAASPLGLRGSQNIRLSVPHLGIGCPPATRVLRAAGLSPGSGSDPGLSKDVLTSVRADTWPQSLPARPSSGIQLHWPAQEFPGKGNPPWSGMAPPAWSATGSWCIGLGLRPPKPFPGVSTILTATPLAGPWGKNTSGDPTWNWLLLGNVDG